MANYIQDEHGRMAGSRPGNARAEKVALANRADQRHKPDRSQLDVRRIQRGQPFSGGNAARTSAIVNGIARLASEGFDAHQHATNKIKGTL
jgi:hypothetical protein